MAHVLRAPCSVRPKAGQGAWSPGAARVRMLVHALPDLMAASGEETRAPWSGRQYVSGTSRTARPEKAGRGAARSLSPPTEEDLNHISLEAMKWAEARIPEYAKSKDVGGGPKAGMAPGADAGEEAGQAQGLDATTKRWSHARADPPLCVPPPKVSGISKLFGTSSGCMSPSHSRIRYMSLKVFCPFMHVEGQRLTPTVVRVSDQATVVDVIRATLRVLREDDPGATFSPNPDAYRLRVAEDDNGKPDEDLPVLDKRTILRRMGFDTLVLCAANTNNFESNGQPNKTLEDIVFNIVSGPERKVLKHLTLPPDVTFKDCNTVICDRLKKEAAKHTVRVIIDGTEKDKDSIGEDHILLGERTLVTLARQYKVSDLYLKSRHSENNDSESDKELEAPTNARTKMFFDWDEASASRYTEYSVIKINKFGSRQERTMGIDRDKIYNMMRGNKDQKTKNPERSIIDITSIRTFDDKPCYLEVEYRNCKSGKDQIQCQTPIEALEMASKLRFLLNFHKTISQQTHGPAKHSQQLSTANFISRITPQALQSPRAPNAT